jgi:hypothetical protein
MPQRAVVGVIRIPASTRPNSCTAIQRDCGVSYWSNSIPSTSGRSHLFCTMNDSRRARRTLVNNAPCAWRLWKERVVVCMAASSWL